MTQIVSALQFGENASVNNRFAQVNLDASIDKTWIVILNGTDTNGSPVIPAFVAINNYNNASPLNYSVDNVGGSVAAYTTVVLQVDVMSDRLEFDLSGGQTTILISEKKLPINEGQKYQGSTTAPVTGPQTLFITGGASFVVPATWNNANNKIHVIGAGANGSAGSGGISGAGGGGGAYAFNSNVALVPGATVNCQVGAGLDTWVNSAATLLAKASTSSTGGAAGPSVGSFKRGGGGGSNNGGGGGAGGPDGSGNNAAATTGGSGNNGAAGGGAGGTVGNNGGDGNYWNQTTPVATGGPGGGAGGLAGAGVGKNAGNYGGGGGGGFSAGNAGGAGAPGLIVLEWTP